MVAHCRWQISCDFAERHAMLNHRAVKLTQWQPEPSEPPTEVYSADESIWLVRSNLGGLGFNHQANRVYLSVAPNIDAEWLRQLFEHYWLPFAYVYWGWQVLHASAVMSAGLPTQSGLIAFSGPSGAGKSTFAFALGRRGQWIQACDDSLLFDVGLKGIAVRPLGNQVRLRHDSAQFFSLRPGHRPLPARAGVHRLAAIYRLEPTTTDNATRITALNPSEAYTTLLEQAFTLPLPVHRHRLMRDYLQLTAQVPVYRVAYAKNFNRFDATLDEVANHMQRQLIAIGRNARASA